MILGMADGVAREAPVDCPYCKRLRQKIST